MSILFLALVFVIAYVIWLAIPAVIIFYAAKISNYEFYFDDSRLRMTVAGRMLVRVISYVASFVLFVATFMFLLSYDIRSLFFFGMFLFLVDIDLLMHHGEGDTPISKFPKEGRVNLAGTMNRAAFNVLERAVDQAAITKKSFLLELTSRLFETTQIHDGLRRLDVDPKAFKAKLEALMAEPPAPENYLVMVESLAAHAFASAISAGHDFIKPADIFSALPAMENERLDRLFSLFDIKEGDLERALIFSALAGGSGFFARLPSVLGGFAPEGASCGRASHYESRMDVAPHADTRQVWHRLHRSRARPRGRIPYRP